MLKPAIISLCAFACSSASYAAKPLQNWRCKVEAEFQCAHGKSDAITRTAVGRSEMEAFEKASDAIRFTACMPADGTLKYFKVLVKDCALR
jgi:hypothetical protein